MAIKKVRPKGQPAQVIAPQPGPQAMAMQSDADLIIYGGLISWATFHSNVSK